MCFTLGLAKPYREKERCSVMHMKLNNTNSQFNVSGLLIDMG